MERGFWFRSSQWPSDPKGYVFLARAFHEVGKALHGQDWKGTEAMISAPTVLPLIRTDRHGDLLYARQLLEQHRPDLELTPVQPGGPHGPRVLPVSAEQWVIAREISQELWNTAQPALRRRASVEAEIVRRCEANELASFYRPTKGGALSPIDPCWWNTERNHNRFEMCQLNPHDPFGIGFAGNRFAWIFVSRESLDRCTATLPHRQFNCAVAHHLSPYMKLMLSVAEALDITVGNQPKKEVVIEELRKAWRGKPLSAKLIDAMATLLREPESQLGRARPKKSEPAGR